MLGAPPATDPHEHVGVEELPREVSDQRGYDRTPDNAEDRGKGLLVGVVGSGWQVLNDEERDGGQEGSHETHDDDAPRSNESVDFR